MIYAALSFLALALLAVAYRAIRGPEYADRFMALDYGATILVAAMGVIAVASDLPATLDVAIVVALIGFVSTTALAKHIGGPDGA